MSNFIGWVYNEKDDGSCDFHMVDLEWVTSFKSIPSSNCPDFGAIRFYFSNIENDWLDHSFSSLEDRKAFVAELLKRLSHEET